MKTLFALFAVAALAAVGCDDKKTTKSTTGTNTTLVQTGVSKVPATAHVTTTVIHNTVIERDTRTAGATVVVPGTTKTKGGPVLDPKKNDKD